MAQKPPIGKDAFPVTDERFRAVVDSDLSDFYERLRKETLQQYIVLSQVGLVGEELADRIIGSLNSLSDRPIEESARGATTLGFNGGRNLEIQKQVESIREVVRVEILDGNTCDPCQLLDGAVYQVNSPEYFQDMPPNHCDGRDLCRGFYLVRAA